MKKMKSNLDEMQEQKLLKIEHRGCWLAFWGLFIAIYAQIAMGNSGFEAIGGESIVMLILGAYMLIACIRNGIWDRTLKPNRKTNLTLSLITGLAVGGFWFITSYLNYHKFLGSVATFAIMFISVSLLAFACLSLSSAIYKRKKQHLDEQADKEENESL